MFESYFTLQHLFLCSKFDHVWKAQNFQMNGKIPHQIKGIFLMGFPPLKVSTSTLPSLWCCTTWQGSLGRWWPWSNVTSKANLDHQILGQTMSYCDLFWSILENKNNLIYTACLDTSRWRFGLMSLGGPVDDLHKLGRGWTLRSSQHRQHPSRKITKSTGINR